ncbi:MAG: DUF4830 domain-containing protein [Oscillospiraceae bacterium]|nr:DUF4830 domain-containing protein [Oscillospiraceae bacterium]
MNNYMNNASNSPNNASNSPSKPKKTTAFPLLIIAVIFALLVILFLLSQLGSFPNSPNAPNAPNVPNSPNSPNAPQVNLTRSPADAAEYLRGLGWEVSAEPTTIRSVIIPEMFDNHYEDYNALQKLQGFDLSDFRAKSVTQYTFRVFNHPSEAGSHVISPGGVFANVLVHEGQVIGGDLVSYALNGFLTTLTTPLASD